jgi:hypothetical protein
MVLVTQGEVAAPCSAAKAMGATAEARRRMDLKNCIVVECVVDIDVVDCLLIRIVVERLNGAGRNECDSPCQGVWRLGSNE